MLETYNAAKDIHGGTEGNDKAVAVGLVETLDTKFSKNLVCSLVSEKPKLAKQVASTFHNAKCKIYENSDDNILRNVSVYYSMGVMGKRKNMKVRHSLSFKKALYKGKKMCMLKSSKLPCACLFYLKLYKPDEFDWFEKPFTFTIAIGGDGAPVGKYDQSSSWLVSFLNVGKRFLSSDDNFLIFGANCSKSCLAVERYITKLVSDVAYLESKAFTVDGKTVKFEFARIPNDIKMLSFLGGELSNSAKYFSSFGNVTYDDMANLQFTFGRAHTNQWKPWEYGKRLKVAKQVEELKNKLAKTSLSASTKRGKVTSLIAEKQSRQEFAPRIGKLIEKAHVEPLQLKNNGCAFLFTLILEFAIEISKLPQNVTEFQKVNTNTPFVRLITSLKKERQVFPA